MPEISEVRAMRQLKISGDACACLPDHLCACNRLLFLTVSDHLQAARKFFLSLCKLLAARGDKARGLLFRALAQIEYRLKFIFTLSHRKPSKMIYKVPA